MRNLTIAVSALLASSLAGAASQIPLCPGLTVVTALAETKGDYESIKTVESVGPQEVRINYSAEVADTALFAEDGSVMQVRENRRVRTQDLRAARHYLAVFAQESDQLFPGTTAIGTSTSVLRNLKAQGQDSIVFNFDTTAEGELRVSRQNPGNVYELAVTAKLERVGTVKVPLLVNDRRVDLDAIKARAQFEGASEPSEFIFLDDEENPLTLRFSIHSPPPGEAVPGMAETCAMMKAAGMPVDEELCSATGPWAPTARSGTLTVTKINYRCGQENPASSLENSLEKDRKADIYSIYFSFNSDVIRKESEPTLKELANLMGKHPDWKLSIHGHTDSIASDRYNLDLSQRRAAAVVNALTSRYGVDGSRFSFAGHGESSPKDTNETLEGRARNRRVELIRLQ